MNLRFYIYEKIEDATLINLDPLMYICTRDQGHCMIFESTDCRLDSKE